MTTVDTSPALAPTDALGSLQKHVLWDGMELVLDLEASHGSHLVDSRDGRSYLDMFTFFASSALGMNHPKLFDEAFSAELLTAARNKPTNGDVVTVQFARFVDTFTRVLGDTALPHLFFIDGGTLAVENALKAAFDWKSRWNEAHGIDPGLGGKVLHLVGAFHGRSGYTLSLTNGDDHKVARFPKFDWPRIEAPYTSDKWDVEERERLSLAQARAAFEAHPHDIACFLAEPIQSEGGDHHLRPQFFQAMQELCREYDALLVIDEVQTGVGLTGSAWAYQQLGISPDVVAFGKKTQVCGVMGGGRIDEVPDNVFRVSGRIDSTWNGNFTDMIRSRRILEIIEEDGLIARAATLGSHLLERLKGLADKHDVVTNPRGRGLMCAVSLPDKAFRTKVAAAMRDEESVLLLGCGERSVRFRPALTVNEEELDAAVDALDAVLTRMAG